MSTHKYDYPLPTRLLRHRGLLSFPSNIADPMTTFNWSFLPKTSSANKFTAEGDDRVSVHSHPVHLPRHEEFSSSSATTSSATIPIWSLRNRDHHLQLAIRSILPGIIVINSYATAVIAQLRTSYTDLHYKPRSSTQLNCGCYQPYSSLTAHSHTVNLNLDLNRCTRLKNRKSRQNDEAEDGHRSTSSYHPSISALNAPSDSITTSNHHLKNDKERMWLDMSHSFYEAHIQPTKLLDGRRFRNQRLTIDGLMFDYHGCTGRQIKQLKEHQLLAHMLLLDVSRGKMNGHHEFCGSLSVASTAYKRTSRIPELSRQDAYFAIRHWLLQALRFTINSMTRRQVNLLPYFPPSGKRASGFQERWTSSFSSTRSPLQKDDGILLSEVSPIDTRGLSRSSISYSSPADFRASRWAKDEVYGQVNDDTQNKREDWCPQQHQIQTESFSMPILMAVETCMLILSLFNSNFGFSSFVTCINDINYRSSCRHPTDLIIQLHVCFIGNSVLDNTIIHLASSSRSDMDASACLLLHSDMIYNSKDKSSFRVVILEQGCRRRPGFPGSNAKRTLGDLTLDTQCVAQSEIIRCDTTSIDLPSQSTSVSPSSETARPVFSSCTCTPSGGCDSTPGVLVAATPSSTSSSPRHGHGHYNCSSARELVVPLITPSLLRSPRPSGERFNFSVDKKDMADDRVRFTSPSDDTTQALTEDASGEPSALLHPMEEWFDKLDDGHDPARLLPFTNEADKAVAGERTMRKMKESRALVPLRDYARLSRKMPSAVIFNVYSYITITMKKEITMVTLPTYETRNRTLKDVPYGMIARWTIPHPHTGILFKGGPLHVMDYETLQEPLPMRPSPSARMLAELMRLLMSQAADQCYVVKVFELADANCYEAWWGSQVVSDGTSAPGDMAYYIGDERDPKENLGYDRQLEEKIGCNLRGYYTAFKRPQDMDSFRMNGALAETILSANDTIRQSHIDRHLFWEPDGKFYVLVFGQSLFIIAKNHGLINNFIKGIKPLSAIETSLVGQSLGIQVRTNYEERYIGFDQRIRICELMEKYRRMTAEQMTAQEFRRLVHDLVNIAAISRFEVYPIVCQLERGMYEPLHSDKVGALKLLRFLDSTMDREVRFTMNDDNLHFDDPNDPVIFGRIGFRIDTEFVVIKNGDFDKVCSSGAASHLGHEISVASLFVNNLRINGSTTAYSTQTAEIPVIEWLARRVAHLQAICSAHFTDQLQHFFLVNGSESLRAAYDHDDLVMSFLDGRNGQWWWFEDPEDEDRTQATVLVTNARDWFKDELYSSQHR